VTARAIPAVNSSRGFGRFLNEFTPPFPKGNMPTHATAELSHGIPVYIFGFPCKKFSCKGGIWLLGKAGEGAEKLPRDPQNSSQKSQLLINEVFLKLDFLTLEVI